MGDLAFSIGKQVGLSFDQALVRVQDHLKEEGFGVLFDLDPQAKFKEKLNVTDFPNYRILGACAPKVGYDLLLSQPALGAVVPCHVVVREDSQKQVFVDIVNPDLLGSFVNEPTLRQTVREMGAKLQRILGHLPDP
eukprot:ANDGO_02751.mRNA.1 hypothetical protein